ncbi:hypothetical protein [Spirochaeta dissipatitropha]
MSEHTSYFDSIMTGLNESLEYSRGNSPALRTRKVTITPVPEYDAEKIKAIRNEQN